jgi:hypothetical protein
LIVNGGMDVVVVGGTVVVVGGRAVEVVVVSLDVVSATSGEHAVAMTARTSKTERLRYIVDLEMVVRSPSRDRPGTLTV